VRVVERGSLEHDAHPRAAIARAFERVEHRPGAERVRREDDFPAPIDGGCNILGTYER
jgi:hypothetical protein